MPYLDVHFLAQLMYWHRAVRNLDSSKWMGSSAVSNIQQNISAYEAAPSLPSPTTAGEQPRPIYPEDSYVQFVVTTKVQSETPAAADDGLGGEP